MKLRKGRFYDSTLEEKISVDVAEIHDKVWGEIWEEMIDEDEEPKVRTEGIFWNGQYYTIIKSGYTPMITVSISTALKLLHDTPEFYKEIHHA